MKKGAGNHICRSNSKHFLADISGDGLTDILRVRNGDIYYWPNLGYGRFGAKSQHGECAAV